MQATDFFWQCIVHTNPTQPVLRNRKPYINLNFMFTYKLKSYINNLFLNILYILNYFDTSLKKIVFFKIHYFSDILIHQYKRFDSRTGPEYNKNWDFLKIHAQLDDKCLFLLYAIMIYTQFCAKNPSSSRMKYRFSKNWNFFTISHGSVSLSKNNNMNYLTLHRLIDFFPNAIRNFIYHTCCCSDIIMLIPECF